MSAEEVYEAQEANEQEQARLKDDVLRRMKRIEGQIRGIQRMIEGGKECEDILVQVKAAKSALHAATRQILRRYTLRCYAKAIDEGTDTSKEMEKVIKLMTSFMDM